MIKQDSTVQNWFKYARVDLQMAQVLWEKQNPEMWRGVAYNCQQSVEKAIKGYLVFKKIKFPKTHDIGSLATQVLKLNPELEAIMKRASTLTPYALILRYPEAVSEELTEKNIKEALDCAQKVLESLSSLIPFKSSIF